MFEALHPRRFRRENPEAVAIGRLFVVLAAVHLWTLAVATGYAQFSSAARVWSAAPLVLGAFVTDVLGFGLAALAYVSRRRLDVPTGAPAVSRTLLVAVLTPLCLVGVVALGAHAGDTSLAALSQRTYSPTVELSFLVQTALVPAGFEAVGTGLLLFAAVQTRLSDVTTPAAAVVLTPVVAGVFFHAPMEALSLGRLDAVAFLLFALSVVVSVGVGLTAGLLYRGLRRDDLNSVLRPAYAPVLVVGGVGLLGALLELVELPHGVVDVLSLVVVAVAAVAYARTRSVWTPIATLFIYHVAVGAVTFLEVTAGLAPTP
jgi:hypothetical protein